MAVDDDTRLIYVNYCNTVHTISIKVISVAMGIQPGYTGEQNPKVSQALGDWVQEIVSGGQLEDGYVKLGGLLKNQLLVHAWLNDNIIPRYKALN